MAYRALLSTIARTFGEDMPVRRLPRNSVDRPRIQLSSCLVQTEKGHRLPGLHPRLIVTLAWGSNAARKRAREFCWREGIRESSGFKSPIQTFGDYAAFDVCGSVESLKALICKDFLRDWQFAISASVGVISGGSGEERVKSSGKSKPAKWHGSPYGERESYRQAIADSKFAG